MRRAGRARAARIRRASRVNASRSRCLEAAQRFAVDTGTPRVVHGGYQSRLARGFALGLALRGLGLLRLARRRLRRSPSPARPSGRRSWRLGLRFRSWPRPWPPAWPLPCRRRRGCACFPCRDLKSVSYQPEPFSRNTGADMSFFSPLLAAARALLERLVVDLLQHFFVVAAVRTFVFVERHGYPGRETRRDYRRSGAGRRQSLRR